MPTLKEVKISWGPIVCECDTCLCSTQISFRKTTDNNWYTPGSPTNPTQELSYNIIIEAGVHYQVRLTFIGPRCHQKIQYISIYYPLANCCPLGYTAAPDGTYCYKVEEIAATPPSGSVQTLVAKTDSSYSTCGAYIYNPGYALDGTGPATQIPFANGFWHNGGAECVNSASYLGPLNRAGVWTTTTSDGQDIGFGVCLDLPVAKTYYIGIAADNYGIITVDNNLVVQQDPVTLASQYSQGPASTFKIWHIYPVFLSAGPHILELRAHNVLGVAALGCEVYNATAAELIAATSYADLGAKLIFSSKNQIGQPAQLGTGNVGYTCPAGYSISPCSGTVKCQKIFTSPPVNC
jgi:hypothetical protein